MAARSLMGSALCIVLFYIISVRAQQDPDLVTAAAAALEPQAVTPDKLPATRPAMPKAGWNMCTYSCMTNKLADAVKTNGTGVLEIFVVHKPIKGVNTKMIQWLFSNFNNTAKHYVDNQLYKMHMLFHPVDNCFYTPSTNPLAPGSTVQYMETLVTRCTYSKNKPASPWTCRKNRTGLTSSSNLTAITGMPYTDLSGAGSAKVRVLDATGYRQSIEIVTPAARNISSLSFKWADTPQGLQVNTTLLIGLMAEGSDTVFDTAFAAVANPQILAALQPAIGRFGVAAYGSAVVLHQLQAFDWTRFWLPKVYRTKK